MYITIKEVHKKEMFHAGYFLDSWIKFCIINPDHKHVQIPRSVVTKFPTMSFQISRAPLIPLLLRASSHVLTDVDFIDLCRKLLL